MEKQTRNPQQKPNGGKKPAPKGGGTSGARKNAGSRSGSVSGSRGERVRISAEMRRKKKKRRDAFIITVMILMLGAVAVALSTTVFFKASDVIVNNQMEMYSEELIIDASGLKAGDNMFTANLEKAAAAIEKQLPYIRKANIRRKWPDAFFIDAEYAETVLAVPKGGAYVYIDIDGKVLEIDVAAPEEGTATVLGAAAQNAIPGTPVTFTDEKALDNLLSVVKAVCDSGIRNVTCIDIANPTDVRIEIEGRIEVKLGSVSTVAEKIEFGKAVIDKNLSGNPEKQLVIDLTAQAKAFVREKEDPTQPTTPPEEEDDYEDRDDENDWNEDEDEDWDDGDNWDDEDENDGGYDENEEESDEEDW
ncbi:MAG: FtsQ-type POTRA domain-containing protein [Clostridia bacterium]|nr:FtsQ-type POTRA domain-containing protein [Clostridia bacterium]